MDRTVTFKQEETSGHGARHQDRQADWQSVAMWLWFWLRLVSSEWVRSYSRTWLDLVIWMKRVWDRVVFTDFTLHSVFTVNSRLEKVQTAKFAARLSECAALCGKKQTSGELESTPRWRTSHHLDTVAGIAEFSVSFFHEQIPRSRHCSTSIYSTQWHLDSCRVHTG
jgi:hypothetical protein